MNEHWVSWIELDRLAFEHNVSQFATLLAGAQLGIVIKANAYGHGMSTIAQMAEHNPLVHWYCVAQLSEALALREYGFKKPILSMGHIDRPLETLIKKDITLSLFEAHTAQQLEAIGRTHNYRFTVHIKIDSGLARLGVLPEEAIPFVKMVDALEYVQIGGIYSHFAESQKMDQSYTLKQVETFKAVVNAIQELPISLEHIHIANSASVPTLALPFCTMARVGAGIYGLYSSPDMRTKMELAYPHIQLKPVLCWKTKIMFTKNVPAGSYIGYDRTYQAPHDMRIATIPIGYYDGYDFRLCNKAHTIIHHEYAPVIGRVAMNITSLDITHIPQASVGDEVILMGDYPKVHPYQLGMLAGNPNVREITTKIGAHIPRTAVNEPQLPNLDRLLYTKAPNQ